MVDRSADSISADLRAVAEVERTDTRWADAAHRVLHDLRQISVKERRKLRLSAVNPEDVAALVWQSVLSNPRAVLETRSVVAELTKLVRLFILDEHRRIASGPAPGLARLYRRQTFNEAPARLDVSAILLSHLSTDRLKRLVSTIWLAPEKAGDQFRRGDRAQLARLLNALNASLGRKTDWKWATGSDVRYGNTLRAYLEYLTGDELLELWPHRITEEGMAISLPDWAALAAIVSAMCDVIVTGRDTFSEFFAERSAAPDAIDRGRAMRAALSTYSDAEIDAIKERLESCRDRFVREGSGRQRKNCLCSVLQDVKDGNGGTMPFEDWQQTYDQLGCAA